MISEWRPRGGAVRDIALAEPGQTPDGQRPRRELPETLRWHVLQTRSRQEKALAELLQDAGASPFLPIFRRVMHYGHRRRTAELPLFPNYLFLWGTVEHTYRAMSSKRAVRSIPISDHRKLNDELTQIRRAIGGDAALSPFRFLERGMRVRVVSGPFKDLEGMVESPEKSGRLILQIQTLGRAASLEIDACLLQRVQDDAEFGHSDTISTFRRGRAGVNIEP